MERSRATNFDKIGLVLLAVVLGLVVWKLQPPADVLVDEPVKVGTPLPPLSVEGWLNVPEGESFDPTGKIVVVDLWATYCPPCVKEIPKLAEVARRYRPLGVEFVSLTDETERDLPQVKAFIDKTPGFDWPVGYGATKVMAELNIPGIPTLIVFGPDGRARWSWLGEGPQGLEAALDELLASQKNADGGESKSAG
jgi:thiol-disulfide isomerase/thioredoxin